MKTRLRFNQIAQFSSAAMLTFVSSSLIPIFAQEATGAGASDEGVAEVIVTGFRASLNQALDDKRTAIGAIDAIVAEDIADFPDLNLAESIQRVPGVSINRDGGEGRQISVRGLGPQFTRVRINGMEAMSSTGSTDQSGGNNRDRSFDFNVFASELFNSITIGKTSAAETEEGSLGATVDLSVARPFDYDGFKLAAGLQGAYNDLSEDTNPRASMLISNTFGEGKFGALLSVAYTDRSLVDEGTSTVRWQQGPANVNATLPNGQSAQVNSIKLAPGFTTYSQQQVNSAFHPRIPRYDAYTHEQERLGVTSSLQFQPAEGTLFTFDALYAKLDSERDEAFLQAPVFSSDGASGIGGVTMRDGFIDANGSLVYGVFDGVDIRSEQRHDELTTEFTQFTLDGEHALTDTLWLHGMVGTSKSEFDNPIQTTMLFDANNIANYSYDYRQDSRRPIITYGATNVENPAAWTLTQIRLRPQSTENTFDNAAFDVTWQANDTFTFKAGAQYKKFEFETTELRRGGEVCTPPRSTAANGEACLPANVVATPIADYSKLISLQGSIANGATPSTWLAPDIGKAASLFNLYDRSVFPLGTAAALANNFGVNEKDTGGFLQTDFATELLGRSLKGNLGVRYVQTKQESLGFGFGGAPVALRQARTYSDTLPSLNLVYELTDELLVRAAAAKVMTRPGLVNLSPGATAAVTGNNKTVTAGNPNLDPFRAKSYDLSFEWYFAPESLLGVSLFYKDVGTFVQVIRSEGAFNTNPFGLPDSVAVAACGTLVDCGPSNTWQFSIPGNTPGGELKGFEVSYQQPFSFLPEPLNDFGFILNYTYVDSQVKYLDPVGTVIVETDLTFLSKNAANGTLYYDNGRWSARVSAAYRDDYLNTVPGRNNNDVEGTLSTLNVDFSASWSVTDHFDVSLEGLNLTDEYNDQYVSSTGDRSTFYHHTGREYILGVRYTF